MSQSSRVVARLRKVTVGFEEAVTVTFLIAVTVLLVTQFVTRYFLSTPLIWTEEASRFCFVWSIFSGAAMLAAKNAHIVVTFISDLVPPRVESLIVRFAGVVTLVGAGITAWAGIGFVEKTSTLLSPALGIPMSYVYLAPVVGFALIAIHAISYIISGSGAAKGAEVEAAI